MLVNKTHYRTIWMEDDSTVQIIDQCKLPYSFEIIDLKTADDAINAIREMHVRGAPLIGVTAAFGIYLACLTCPKNNNIDEYLREKSQEIRDARPTAIDLVWAVDSVLFSIRKGTDVHQKAALALEAANEMAEESIRQCMMIGKLGLELIEKISREKKGDTVNILTHCNAGWLATVDYGTATSPIYMAFEKGLKIHVWVDETRPRNQGFLTAWELSEMGVPHTIIADNTGGHLMQQGKVDIVIVGSDRTTINGDVTNKIGTYLKALAAKDCNVPFYVALPSSSIDWNIENPAKIPIEKRSSEELNYVTGLDEHNAQRRIRITPKGSNAENYGFDVTPSRLVTGLITERGIALPDKESILGLFPEKRKNHADDSYIKFSIYWKNKDLKVPEIRMLNKWRDILYSMKLIGAYENSIGFGNISERVKGSDRFIITGTKTGTLQKLNENNYTLVTKYDFSRNSLTCEGRVKASSESLTHAAVYQSSRETNAVIHIHNKLMWDKIKDVVPATPQNIVYGTPEMAYAVMGLFAETDLIRKKIFAMKGHEEGIIVFGKDLDEAGAILLGYFNNKI